MEVTRITRLYLEWGLVDPFLSPGRTGYAWHIHALADDIGGQRRSIWEAAPETWWANVIPYDSEDYAIRIF